MSSMSITPVSSMHSSPASTSSLPIIDSQSAYDQDWENDIDNEYNENNNDNDNNDNETDDQAPETEIIIVHPPAKGIAAWLSHLHRNQTRNSILQTLRSLVF